MHIKPFTQIWIGLKCKLSITCQCLLFRDNSWGETESGFLPDAALPGKPRIDQRTRVRHFFPQKRSAGNSIACDSSKYNKKVDGMRNLKWADCGPSLVVSSLAHWYISKEGDKRLKVLPQHLGASLVAQMVNNLPAVQEIWVWFLGQEDPLEKGVATHYSILAWRIPWTEEPGSLQPMGSQRVGHDLSD